MALNKALAALIAQAAGIENQTERVSGPEFSLPVAGKSVARFVEYIEIGKRPQKPFKGKDKPDADMVILKFDLLSPKYIKEHEGVKFCDQITVRVKKSLNDKAGFVALFDKMVYGRDAVVHMAQMLGEAFIVDIIHNKGEEAGARTYANIKTAGAQGIWQVGAPVLHDPISDTITKVPVPAAMSEIKFFGWDVPTPETWGSLFIEGEREVDDGKGNKTMKSKNWLQELIMSASDFEGSPLAQMLGGTEALDLPTEEEVTEEVTEEQAEEEPPFEVDAPVVEDTEEVDEIAALKAQLAALQTVKKAPGKPATPAAPKTTKPTTPKPAPAASAKAATPPAKAPAKAAVKAAPASKPAAATDVNAALAALGLT